MCIKNSFLLSYDTDTQLFGNVEGISKSISISNPCVAGVFTRIQDNRGSKPCTVFLKV